MSYVTPVPCPHCGTPFKKVSMISGRCRNNKNGFTSLTCTTCYKDVSFFLDDDGDLCAVPPEKPMMHPLNLLGLRPDTI